MQLLLSSLEHALLQGMSPRVFIVYRQGIATLALAPIAFSSRRRSSFSISSRSFFFMFVTALIGITANQNTYFEGLYLSSSTMASAITNLTPAMTFLIATIVGLEKIDLRSLRSIAKMLGTLLCVGGAITMALLKGQKLLHAEFLSFKHLFVMVGDSWQLGCLLLFASSFCWAFWMIMQVPISSSCPSHLHSSIWMCFLASLQSTIVTLLFENDPEVWNLRSVLDISCCLYAGVGIAVSFFIQTWCISVRGPSLLCNVQPSMHCHYCYSIMPFFYMRTYMLEAW
ncbi:WAT1-related protein [Quillaja saponaria]|uniref:WAT1-related protein n=1 Tax=Quillaja saponaria TaxID=32244 RepID=A0AAD7QDQ8_QUISA|nr:WAT1-related protein [Quillaja saponaria]